ncbi:MAG: NAD(P)H-hydrate dehydratase [Bacteroidota bacterium]
MKILSAKQIYEADEFTIAKQEISSDMLMERAATGVFEWLHKRVKGNPIKIHLFCGIGNNGGDGLAVARHLLEHGYQIAVYVVNYSEKRSQDFLINLDRLKERKLWPAFLDAQQQLPEIHKDDIVVDAIFGIGLNRPPERWVSLLIQHLNLSKAFLLSLDIPSGMYMHKAVFSSDTTIHASQVLSFQFPKLPFFLPNTGIFLNAWELIDIGLDPEYWSQLETAYELVGKTEAASRYISRSKFSHKGNYGHALIAGGSYGKIGAVGLAARACLATGVGLLTTYVPKCGYLPLQTGVQEAMVLTDVEEDHITKITLPFAPETIGIGMGLGTNPKTQHAFEAFVKETSVPLVIDADGLNLLAKNPKVLHQLPQKSILTPHPKELERLIGSWEDDFQKLEKTRKLSKELDCVIIIKGAHTITIYQDKGYVNTTGNPGMATAGSGDVLAGMVTALVAQGYSSLSASIFGVYLHGLAGDLAANKVGYESLTASILVQYIAVAFRELLK